MTEEIKEAILYLEHTSKDDFNLEEHQKENRIWAIKILLNYITNLQNENEELRTDNKRLKHNEKVYKSRNEKAIEYLKKWGEEPDADMYMQIKEYSEYKFLSNILKGGDE